MPNYKVVLFSDPVTQQYMKEQEQAINNALPSVTTEQATHEDSRLQLYSKYHSRMPCLMIFKDGARMQTKHAKRNHAEIIAWIKTIVGA
jgi:hypothetical protein